MQRPEKKRSGYFLVTIICAILTAGSLQSQNTPVEIKKSTERVSMAGKDYLLHTVGAGHTLYSICKAYGVSEDEMDLANPGVKTSIYVGQVLKIPVPKAPSASEQKFISHTALPGETSYFLTKKYNLSLERLYEFNPDIREGIRVGQVVLIPREYIGEDLKKPLPPKEEEFYHTVQPRETPFRLAQMYNVTIDDLVRWNPTMENGFKAGDKIRIVRRAPDGAAMEGVTDSVPLISDTVASPYLPCAGITSHKTFNVALLLPFNAHIPQADESGKVNTEHAYAKNFVEFYQGFLLACDSIRKRGVNINLSVFDTHKDPDHTRKLLEKPELRQADLIIGPVYAECVEVMATFCMETQIPLVSPLSSNKQLISQNPFLFQVIPSQTAETNALGKYINRQMGKNILLVHDGNPLYIDRLYDMRDAIFRNAIQGSPIRFREVMFNDTSVSAINRYLSRDTINTLIVLSTSEPYISKLINKLSMMPIQYPVELIGHQDWQKFINVDIESFHQFRVQYITPFYPDYTTPLASKLVSKYRQAFDDEPVDLTIKGYSFGFLGFDIGYYFLEELANYGKAFPECSRKHEKELMLSTYRFDTLPGHGFENTTLWMLRYSDDFRVVRQPIP